MGRRGGKSVRNAAVRDRLASVMQASQGLQPQSARAYASRIVEAVSGDMLQCRVNDMWVLETMGSDIPCDHCALVTRSLGEYLRVEQRGADAGDEPVAQGVSAQSAVGSGPPPREIVVPQQYSRAVAVMNATQEGSGPTQAGIRNAAPGVTSVTAQFLPLLNDRKIMRSSHVISGYELQWEQSVSAALGDLQSEFSRLNVWDTFQSLDAMSKVLLLREVKAKAVRILAHKKAKIKSKIKK